MFTNSWEDAAVEGCEEGKDCTGNCKEQRGEVLPDCIKVGGNGDVASEMGVALTWMAMPGMARVLTAVQKSVVRSGPTLALDRVNG